MPRDEYDDGRPRPGPPKWLLIVSVLASLMVAAGLVGGVVAWVIAERQAQQEQLRVELARVDEMRAYAVAARREAEELATARRRRVDDAVWPEPLGSLVGGVGAVEGRP